MRRLTRLRKRACNVTEHKDVQVIEEPSLTSPGLFFCARCEQYLGDAGGLQNYGPDRPMLKV